MTRRIRIKPFVAPEPEPAPLPAVFNVTAAYTASRARYMDTAASTLPKPVMYTQGSVINVIHDLAYGLCDGEYDIRTLSYHFVYRFSGMVVYREVPREEFYNVETSIMNLVDTITRGGDPSARATLRRYFTSAPPLFTEIRAMGLL